ncbi:MAG: hypothetical protein IKP47_02290 [Ruminococcus sp.]|nr:hypothetical protein [Ruminococcus sp.]
MYTIFINTAGSPDTTKHRRLWNELIEEKKLFVFNCGVKEFDSAADSISSLISRDPDISEVYNLIVYIKLTGRNEDAVAMERVMALYVEETLLHALYKRGRRANRVLLVFGEDFDRGREYSGGEHLKRRVYSKIWDSFPLPPVRDAAEIIARVRSKYADLSGEKVYDYREEVWEAVTVDEDCFLGKDSKLIKGSVMQMAESVKNLTDIRKADLEKELFNALCDQREGWQANIVSSGIESAHIRLTDSEVHTENRTELTLMLFVYRCAAAEDIILDRDPKEDHAGGDELSIGAASVGTLDFEYLSSCFKDKQAELTMIRNSISAADDPTFPKFNDGLKTEKHIIKLEEEPPELKEKISISKAFSVRGLRKLVDSTLASIEEKDRENGERLNEYITNVTDKFNRDKDTSFKKTEYKNTEETTGNDELYLAKIRKLSDETAAELASKGRLSADASKLGDRLIRAKVRIDYLFECLRGRALVFVMLGIVLFCFAAPYAALRTSILDTTKGVVFYVVTLAGAAAVYMLGYFLFVHKFKKLITAEIKRLCDIFCELQKERVECLEAYNKLLSRDIPLSFLLRRYLDEYTGHIEHKKLRATQKTYHLRELDGYISYLDELLDGTDIRLLTPDREHYGNNLPQLIIEQDVCKNNLIYSVIPREQIDSCFIGNGGEAE